MLSFPAGAKATIVGGEPTPAPCLMARECAGVFHTKGSRHTYNERWEKEKETCSTTQLYTTGEGDKTHTQDKTAQTLH